MRLLAFLTLKTFLPARSDMVSVLEGQAAGLSGCVWE